MTTTVLRPPSLSLELRQRLFQASVRFWFFSAWNIGGVSRVFGIQNEYGVRLVYLFCPRGPVWSLTAFRGTAGAHSLLRLGTAQTPQEQADQFFGIDALALDFPGALRQELSRCPQGERLNLQGAPGPVRLVEFTSFKPGLVPWHMEEGEGWMMLDTLDKAERFLKLARTHPQLYRGRRRHEFPFLPDPLPQPLQAADLTWHVVSAPLPGGPVVNPRRYDLTGLRRLPQLGHVQWEASSFYNRLPINAPPRPYWPKSGAVVDGQSGSLLREVIGGPKDTMARVVAKALVKTLRAYGCRPGTIRMDSPLLLNALEPLVCALDMTLQPVPELPHFQCYRRRADALLKDYIAERLAKAGCPSPADLGELGESI